MTAPIRLLVLGGNGYVGQNICAAAASTKNLLVQSLSRSGAPPEGQIPPHLSAPLSQVTWSKGDIFDPVVRDELFQNVDAVISTIGAFGSNEFMEKLCGDSTISAIESAVSHGVKRFGFVSSAQVGEESDLPSPRMPMYGYFRGKFRAEEALREAFPEDYVILRPGFIYGPRSVGGGFVPLQYVGAPLSFVGTKMGPVSSLIRSIPFVGTEMRSMVSVESVADCMVGSMMEEGGGGRLLTAEDIRSYSK